MRQEPLFEERGERPSCVLSGEGGKDGLGCYRYSLTIPLVGPGGTALFVLANPSTAVVVDGVFHPDPTVAKCVKYSRAWGMSRCVIANVRAWRETDPKLVPADPLAIGPDNDAYLDALARDADLVICGWGRLGKARGPVVFDLLRRAGVKPMALRVSQDGTPWHPLYLRDDAQPFEFGANA